tara:strand:+ start:2379 stop:4019 length:1641 start_codon:yes stop_codon:yes gene_type:complete
MVVPKIAMRYFASSVAVIKGGDRQLKFVKIKKYNNKYFCVNGSGIYELDDQYEYRYFKTGIYFYNFNNSKPLSLTGMQEVDEKLRSVGDATLFNRDRHVEAMRAINPEQSPDPLEMPPDRTEEMSPETRRFLQDYQTDDEFGKTNLMVNVHLQKKSIPIMSPELIPMGVNRGDFAIVQIGHRRIDIVPMKIHNNQAYTSYGVFEVSRDNQYMVKRQVLSFFVLSEKEEDPAQKIPRLAQKQMNFMFKKKRWAGLKSFRKPMAEHFKKEPKTEEKKTPKNISLSSEKTLQQFKADDPDIFRTTVRELFTSKVAVAEKLSDPLKKVIPIALIFGGVMGLMIVMSNAPMVIDKVAEYAGIQPPQVVYLTPFEAIERGLDPDIMVQACIEEYSQTQITCDDYTWFDDKEGGILPLSDPQHSLYGGDIPQDTFLDDLAGGTVDAGTGDETMVQIDDIPPVMTVPETIEEDSDTRDGVIVRYTGLVTASDNSGELPEITCEPKSGSIFKVGETLVKCTAIDSSGNATTGEFLIIVTGEPEDRSLLPEIVTSP